MTDHLTFEPGAAPWRPSSSARLTETFHRYDVPRIGVLAADGQSYLFVRRYKGDESLSIWMYVLLSPGQPSQLVELAAPASIDKFTSMLDEMEDTQAVTYALVHDDSVVLTARLRTPPTDRRQVVAEMIKEAELPADVVTAEEERELLTAVS